MDIQSRKKTYYLAALLTTLLLTACGAGQFFWVTTLTDNLELLDSKPALLDTITDDEGYSYYINYDQQSDSAHTASLNKLSPSGEQLWAVDITEISTTSDNATGAISLNGNIHIVIADNSNGQTRITWGHLSPEGDILNIDQFSVQGRTNPSVYGLDSLTSLLVYYSESDEDNKLQKLDILSTSGKSTILISSSGSGLSGIQVSNGQITARQYLSDSKSIVALDVTGEELWRYELGSEALINWLRDGDSLYLHYRTSSSDKKATFVAVDVISQSITAQSDIDNITLKTVTNDHNIVFTRETYSDTSKKTVVFLGLLNPNGTINWETELTSTIADVSMGEISTNNTSEIAFSINTFRFISASSDFEADVLFKSSVYVLSPTSELLWSSHTQSMVHLWGDLGDVFIATKSSHYRTEGIALDDNGNLYSHGVLWKKSTMPEVSARTSYIGQIRP